MSRNGEASQMSHNGEASQMSHNGEASQMLIKRIEHTRF